MVSIKVIDNPWPDSPWGAQSWIFMPEKQRAALHPGYSWREPRGDTQDRECWVVVLPNDAGVWDTCYTMSDGRFGWQVMGRPPRLTVSPSIWRHGNAQHGEWHGFITNGTLVPAG